MIPQPTITPQRFLLLFAIGAILPALATLAGVLLCRWWKSDRSLVVAIPMQVLVCSCTSGLPLFFTSLRPVAPVIVGATTIAVLGEAILLLVGLQRPHWQEPQGFDVLEAKSKNAGNEQRFPR